MIIRFISVTFVLCDSFTGASFPYNKSGSEQSSSKMTETHNKGAIKYIVWYVPCLLKP